MPVRVLLVSLLFRPQAEEEYDSIQINSFKRGHEIHSNAADTARSFGAGGGGGMIGSDWLNAPALGTFSL